MALRRGLGLLKEMQQWGLRPDVISYTSLLSAGTKAVRLGDKTMASHGLDLLAMMQQQGVQVLSPPNFLHPVLVFLSRERAHISTRLLTAVSHLPCF